MPWLFHLRELEGGNREWEKDTQVFVLAGIRRIFVAIIPRPARRKRMADMWIVWIIIYQ